MGTTLPGRYISLMTTMVTSIFLSLSAQAAPGSFTYQGRIVKSDGSPLEYSNVSFIFQVTDPSGQCIVYQEQTTGINMVNSGGVFDVPVGLGTVNFPLGGNFSILDAFNNTSAFTCGACSGYTCANGSSTYNAASSDIRKLRVQFYDGTGWQTITPDNVIRSVPFAGYSLSAQKLGDNVAGDFLLKTGIPTCTNGTFLSWNGSALACSSVSGANGGTVTSVSSNNAYLTVANGTSTPLITLNVGTAANTVAAGNDTRLVNALQSGSSAGGDLGGNFPNPTVTALQGVSLSAAPPSAGNFLKYNGTNWAATVLSTSDVSGLSTSYLSQSAFNGYVSSASCLSSETMYWNSVAGSFKCQAINVSLAGDVTGTIGASKVVALQNYPVDTTAPATSQVLQWNGTKWIPATLPTGNAGTVTSVTGSGPISVSNNATTPVVSIAQATTSTNGYLSSADWNTFNSKQAAGAYITSLTGDITASGSGAASATVAKLQGSTLTITTPASGHYLRYNGSAFVNSALQATDLSGTLPVASIPAFTGDVTSTAGSISLTVSTVGGSSAANVHSAELLANAASSSNTASTIVKRDASGNFSAGTITASLTGAASLNVLKAGDSMTGSLTHAAGTGDIYVAGSGGNTVTVQGPSGTIGTSYVLRLPAAQGGASQVLTNDGSGNLSWSTPSAGGVTSITVNSPITNSGTASAPVLNVQQANTSQSGYLSSTDWNTFNSKQTSTLTAANIWVGNASNAATAVAPGGDVTMNNAGSFTVTALRGKNVSATLPTTAGQVLRYDGANWTPNSVSMFDLRSTITGSQAFGGVGCTAGQTLTWTAATDNLSCTNISVSDSQITYGSRAANTFLAAPSGGSGAPTFRTIASADLPAGMLSGSGTAGYIPYYNAASTLANSPVYTTAGNVGIGSTNLAGIFTAVGRTDFGLGYTIANGNGAGGTTNGTNIWSPTIETTSSYAPETALRINRSSDHSSRYSSALDIQIGSYAGSYGASSQANFVLANGNTYTPEVTVMSLLANGNVGIGTTSPNATLQVNGTITGKPAVVNGSATVDFGTGNLQYTTSSCGTFNLNNLKDGATYMFAVQGGTSATCVFNAYSDAGVTALTVHYPPDHTSTITGTHTLYNFAVMGGHVYVAWTPGM